MIRSMTLRRRRLLVRFGPAARTWRRADRARRRAIVVVGRPVAAARGMWDGFVDWVNGLGTQREHDPAGVRGRGRASAGAFGCRRLLQADRRRLRRCSTAGPRPSSPARDLLAYRPLVTATGFAAAWAVYRRFGQRTAGSQCPRRPAPGRAPGRTDSHPPGARAHRRKRDHDRRRRLGRQRRPGGRAGLGLRLVAGPDLPVRAEPGVGAGRRRARPRRSRRRSTLRSPAPSSPSRRSSAHFAAGAFPAVVVSSVHRRGRLARGLRQPPRLPDPGRVRLHA